MTLVHDDKLWHVFYYFLLEEVTIAVQMLLCTDDFLCNSGPCSCLSCDEEGKNTATSAMIIRSPDESHGPSCSIHHVTSTNQGEVL